MAEYGILASFTDEVAINGGERFQRPCDILMRAAAKRVITAENA